MELTKEQYDIINSTGNIKINASPMKVFLNIYAAKKELKLPLK